MNGRRVESEGERANAFVFRAFDESCEESCVTEVEAVEFSNRDGATPDFLPNVLGACKDSHSLVLPIITVAARRRAARVVAVAASS